jgi:hypothetical protein
MDYCEEECRDVFTPGQIERMHALLEYQRLELFSDDVFCFGDLDGDCNRGTSDILYLLAQMGCEYCTDGDLDLDHFVTSNDLLYLLNVYGDNCNCYNLVVPDSPARKPEDVYELLRQLQDYGE